jgi:hypothetical protein
MQARNFSQAPEFISSAQTSKNGFASNSFIDVNTAESTPVSSFKKKRKAPIKNSPIYEHCTEFFAANNIRKIKCNHCDKDWVWCGSTSNMREHLKNNHNINFQSNNDHESDDEVTKSKPKRKQGALLDKMVLKFIVSSSCPFRVVENKEFKQLINALDGTYDLPNRKQVAGTLLNEEFQNQKHKTTNELIQAVAIALTLDLWTSCQQYPYLGVTAHFLDEFMKLCSRTLCVHHLPGSHTTDNIKNGLLEILNDWKIGNKVIAVLTDNASNVKNLSESLNKSNRRDTSVFDISQISCCAHILNLIVEKVTKLTQGKDATKEIIPLDEVYEEDLNTLTDLDDVTIQIYQKLLTKCRNVVSAFHHSNILFDTLSNKQLELNIKQNHLIQDVKTRWILRFSC